jgi:hypothetical protein
MKSTQIPSSSASKNLLVHNNELVSEIVSLREALRRRNKEIGLLRLELLRQHTPMPQDSLPEKEKREVTDASTQTEAAAGHRLTPPVVVLHHHREVVSPERNNKLAAIPPSSKVRNSPERLHSPIRRRESALAAVPAAMSPLPRGRRGKLFKGMDSLQLLSSSMTTIRERDDVDESMIV